MIDYVAPTIFVSLWIAHSWLVERSPWRVRTLSHQMDKERKTWMETMATREMRMIDTNIVSGLQNGTAFFASTSMFAIGGAFTLLNFTDQFLSISSSLPLMTTTDPATFQIKAIGLMLLYAYAFLKFGWAYRLFNYASILIGAVAMPHEIVEQKECDLRVSKASAMSVEAAREFNRGQRAFFIAIGYLGWFLGDILFMVSSLAVYAMMIKRQFFSPARTALISRP